MTTAPGSAPHQLLPWGTAVVLVGSAAAFLIDGSAPGYVRREPDGGHAFPDVEVFLLDAFRHPDVLPLLASLILVAPVSVVVERVVGAVGVASVYVLAGFGAGFLEAARMAAPVVPVAGAFGGATALLTMWWVDRHRRHGDLLVATAVVAGWLLATTVLRPGPFPVLACGIAVWTGLYAMDATPKVALRSETRDP